MWHNYDPGLLPEFSSEIIQDIKDLEEMELVARSLYLGTDDNLKMVMSWTFPRGCINKSTVCKGTISKVNGRIVDTRVYHTDKDNAKDGICKIFYKKDVNSTASYKMTISEFRDWLGWKTGDGKVEAYDKLDEKKPAIVDPIAEAELDNQKALAAAGMVAPPLEAPDPESEPGIRVIPEFEEDAFDPVKD